jgi:hypothetical protein
MTTLSRRQFLVAVSLGVVVSATNLLDTSMTTRTHMIAAVDAPVRQWAAADAPLLMRTARGSLAVELDRIETGSGVWIAVTDLAGRLLGWSPAGAWRLSQT